MALYESEQEQIDAIKNWWQENGSSLLTGVILGLALLFGWRGWQAYTHAQAEMASGLYDQVMIDLEQGKTKEAYDVASKLLSEQSNSPYAVLAQLNLAAQDLKDNNLSSSHARLQWAIDKNTIPPVSHIARLRKAKLFLSEDKVEEAKRLLDSVVDKGQYQASYAQLRGDIAMAQGRLEEARQAYTEALQKEVLEGDKDGGLFSREEKELVQMKLDNLGSQDAPVLVKAPPPVAVPADDVTGTPSTAQQGMLTVPVAPATPVTLPSVAPKP